jgi:hypothetical protein
MTASLPCLDTALNVEDRVARLALRENPPAVLVRHHGPALGHFGEEELRIYGPAFRRSFAENSVSHSTRECSRRISMPRREANFLRLFLCL